MIRNFQLTGENLYNKLEDSLEKNQLAKEKVVCCVRDDATNMISATNNLDFDSFQCAAHFINLIIHDSLDLIKIKPFVDIVKEWTKECRKTIGKQILIRHQIANNLSVAMAENILVLKANLDKLQLAPSVDPDVEDVLENEIEDIDYLDLDEI
jgi:hypothetical protein